MHDIDAQTFRDLVAVLRCQLEPILMGYIKTQLDELERRLQDELGDQVRRAQAGLQSEQSRRISKIARSLEEDLDRTFSELFGLDRALPQESPDGDTD
jgi:hypothetical protein